MTVRDLLTVISTTQIVEIYKIGAQRTDRISCCKEFLFKKTKYSDCKIVLMRTYIENNQVILRVLIS